MKHAANVGGAVRGAVACTGDDVMLELSAPAPADRERISTTVVVADRVRKLFKADCP